MLPADIAIEIRDVDVLFGPDRQRQRALDALDDGADREAILAATGMVLGVADASLSVPAGSLSVLMGLSGSGKSSLLRCVNGLNTITRGSLIVRAGGTPVELAGLSGKPLRQLRRQRLAMVFQQFGLLPWATVRENVAFGLTVRGENARETARMVEQQLELVHLEAWADKRIDQLSGGMQQRVGLARAFATDADVLLMDEPFSALDPLIREHLQDELLALQQRLGKTILFVSHDLDEALKLGDQVTLMEGGRIVQTGVPSSIVFEPATDYVRRFVAGINPLSILTAGTVMTPLAASGGAEHSVHDVERSDGNVDAGAATAGADTTGVPGGGRVTAEGSTEVSTEGSTQVSIEGSADDVTGGSSIALPGGLGKLTLKDGRAASLALDGTSLPTARLVADEPMGAEGVAMVEADTSVRALLRQADSSPHPIIVVDQDESPIGFVIAADIIRALATRRG